MHSIIHPTKPSRIPATETAQPYRSPHYDCQDQMRSLKLIVYVPGVDATGVEIASRGPDLTVTARKTHLVRVNWQAAHLEAAQHDYQLRLRLGAGFDYASLQATLRDGVLMVEVPKKRLVAATHPSLLERLDPLSRVA